MFSSPILKVEGQSVQVPAMQGFPHRAQDPIGGITGQSQLFSGSDLGRCVPIVKMALHQLRRSFYQSEQLTCATPAGIGSQHFLQIRECPDISGHDTPYRLKVENNIVRPSGTHLPKTTGGRFYSPAHSKIASTSRFVRTFAACAGKMRAFHGLAGRRGSKR
jgi:hypothetical protein